MTFKDSFENKDTKEFKDGYLAYNLGKGQEDCPYEYYEKEFDDWMDGYDVAFVEDNNDCE